MLRGRYLADVPMGDYIYCRFVTGPPPLMVDQHCGMPLIARMLVCHVEALHLKGAMIWFLCTISDEDGNVVIFEVSGCRQKSVGVTYTKCA